MKITVEFDTWEEMEIFRTSGKKTRGKAKDEDVTVEEVTEKVAQMNTAMATQATAPTPSVQAPASAFQANLPAQPAHGFPGAATNGATPPLHSLAVAVISKIDGAIASGQPTESIAGWFRQQIGPDAAQATLDQIKQIYIPRMTEAQLKQIAPQLGIQG
jgi:hypothetical protein